MPKPKPKPAVHDKPSDTSAAVDAFMAALQHPRKAQLEALRRLILSVDAGIAEGIKWDAPSFRTSEYFATTNLRGAGGIRLILHLGARARALPEGGVVIDDPDGLLRWLAADRALVECADAAALDACAPALRALLRQWIACV